MDFVWITNDVGDITAVNAGTGISGGGTSGAVTITNSMATEIAAKGDLIAGTGSQTFDNVSVGTNGQVLTADSSTATGLAWTTVSGAPTSLGFAAGKNKIINGDFGINQRNTFTATNPAGYVMADRWVFSNYVSGTNVCSMQTFTPGTAPVAGYEGQYFARFANSGQSSASQDSILIQRIEDVRTFANQTVTVSFWAKCDVTSKKIAVEMVQNFGSGGSPSSAVNTYFDQVTLTTSWARYTVTGTVPSIAGKTIGTTANTSSLQLFLWNSAGSDYNARTGSIGIQNNTFDMWGIQIEAGSTATAFQTATGTIQGELAACQRYYWRSTPSSGYGILTTGGGVYSTTQADVYVANPVQMRVTPTSMDFSTLELTIPGTSNTTVTGLTFSGTECSALIMRCAVTVASGLTASRTCSLRQGGSSAAYLGFSAEL
jgi:hypothetical protein